MILFCSVTASVQQQLQQNQLMATLNQSYFQLVTSQAALSDRFSRLEQVVLGPVVGSRLSNSQQDNSSCVFLERANPEGNTQSTSGGANHHTGNTWVSSFYLLPENTLAQISNVSGLLPVLLA